MPFLEDEIKEATDAYASQAIDAIERTKPKHGAILPSEMLVFCCLCLHRGCQRIVESGRRSGYSTEVLCRIPRFRFIRNGIEDTTYWWPVISIDSSPNAVSDERFKSFVNVELVRKDGSRFVDEYDPGEENSGLLLDGPKGRTACELAERNRTKFSVIAIHDAYPGSESRARLEGKAFFTDSEWVIDRFGHLDREMLAYRGYQNHGDLLGQGNVLAVIA